jgi:hypothetical protein
MDAAPHGSIFLRFIVLNVKQKEGQERPQQVRVDTFPRGSVLMNELMSLLMQRVAEVGVHWVHCNECVVTSKLYPPTHVLPGLCIVQLHPAAASSVVHAYWHRPNLSMSGYATNSLMLYTGARASSEAVPGQLPYNTQRRGHGVLLLYGASPKMASSTRDLLRAAGLAPCQLRKTAMLTFSKAPYVAGDAGVP